MNDDRLGFSSVLAVFVVAYLLVPLAQLDFLRDMPGNIGDARLNNYFLENVYQYLSGRSDSLWHLGFFSPFPYVLGFSDNLFGSSPVYVLSRLITGETDTAYQLWFLFGYVANYGAAYYALRRLGGSRTASLIGALIFAFSLPTTAHAGHAQLHYRFGVPLALAFFVLFLERKEWRLLAVAGMWLVWQFYCGVYIGFFTLLLLAAGAGVYVADRRYNDNKTLSHVTKEFALQWRVMPRREKRNSLFSLAVLLGLLLLLFYPYLQVSHLYRAKRSWGEISLMLPRPQSYFLSDDSDFWSSPDSGYFANIPMRHEHQMYIGLIPMLLAVIGFQIGSRQRNGQAFTLMSGMLGVAILLTLYVGGFSLWYLLHKLPLASAIRAMTRLDQVLLFPVAYLAGIAIDRLRHGRRLPKLIWLVVLPLMIIEFSATSMGVSAKEDWRRRLIAREEAMPRQLSKDAILFFAQGNGPFYADELDAMWVSLNHGVRTMNGYSGIFPPDYAVQYGNDCSEVPKRVFSYLSFSGQSGSKDAYLGLMEHIVPIGFEGCKEEWFIGPAEPSRR